MYHTTLDDVEGRNFKVLGVVYNYGAANDTDFILNELDKEAESLGANGIIGMTYSYLNTWSEEPRYEYTMNGRIDYDVRIPDILIYGTAVKIED